MTDPMHRLERDFAEQIAGTSPPTKPDPPLPTREATPVPEWPKKDGGHVL